MLARLFILLAALVITSGGRVAKADDFSSENFITRDPVLLMGAEQSTSDNFQLISNSGLLVASESSSSKFKADQNIVQLPSVTTPVLTVTAHTTSADLSWTSAVGSLGITVGSYEIGQSLISGGPYSYFNVGSLLTRTQTGLSANTRYYFIVRVRDTEGSVVATSSAVAVTTGSSGTSVNFGISPVSVSTSVPTSAAAAASSSVAQVTFFGYTSPLASVILLKDGEFILSSQADQRGRFELSLTDLGARKYTFSLASQDINGDRSALVAYPVDIAGNDQARIGAVFLSPTLKMNSQYLTPGESLAVTGSTLPRATIIITLTPRTPGNKSLLVTTTADENGFYQYQIPARQLGKGNFIINAEAKDNQVGQSNSSLTQTVIIDEMITDSTISKKVYLKGDLNADGRVNFIDVSIALFWYKRPPSPLFATVEAERLNGDGAITLSDFSIIAYYWTS